MRLWQSALSAAATSVLLAACASAPTVQPLALRQQTRVLASDAPRGEQWPEAQWWQRYHDTDLDQLIDLALRNAPTLAAAEARLLTAQQSVRVTGAAQGLQLEGSAGLSRQRISDNGLFPPRFLEFNSYNLADLGLNARYSFDWWGKQRANVMAAVDTARAAQAERRAADLQISALVAEQYFGWQADQQRLVLLQQRQALLTRQSGITQRRIQAQLDSADAAHRIAQDQAAALEQIAAVQASAQLRRVAMAALLGAVDQDIANPPVKPLPQIDLQLPANASLDLVAHRPDITASRWRVEALQQGLVSTRAEYYPDVSLRALVGLESRDLGKLLLPGSAVPSLGVAVHLPFFDGGLRDARFAAQQAQLREAIADYDATVFAAAREAGNAVAAGLSAAAQQRGRQQQLLELRALVTAAVARTQAGTSDIRPQLALELEQLANRDALTQLQLSALSADIALQRALGGGYLATEDKP